MMPHDPLDAFGQYRFLDPVIFGTSFVRFRNEYAVMGGYGGHQVLGFKNVDQLQSKAFAIARQVKKADVLDLPSVIHETRHINLNARTAKAYAEMSASFVTDVGCGAVTASNALVRLIRLQQITSGHLPDPESDDTIEVGTDKRDELAAILEDIDRSEAIVVFCRFLHDLDAVHAAAKAAGRTSVEVSGRRKDVQAVWQADDKATVLAAQIASGGIGVDYTRSAYCVLYSTGFNLGHYEQAIARLDRKGQTRSVTYIHLLARATVDEKVKRALDARKNIIDSVLDDAAFAATHGVAF